jgi:hypothetical protein
MASTIIEVNFYVRNIWAFYFYIVVICLFITLIREKHGGEVHTLWFVFVLTTGFGFAIYYYLNISGSIVISENGIHVVERSSVEGGFFGFLEKLLKWWLQSSINVEEELTILLYVVVAVILPQSLSYVISGIFGCARPPILVAKVTKGAFYAVIKCYCVLAALVTSEKLFLLYMNSVFSVWDLQRPLLLLSVTFFLAFLYHSAHTIAHTSFKYINELKPPADCGVGLPFRERMSQYLGVVPDKLDSGRLAVAWLAKFVTDDVRKFMTKFTSQSDESQRTRGQAVASVVAAALQESTVRDEIGRLVSEEVHRRWAQ